MALALLLRNATKCNSLLGVSSIALRSTTHFSQLCNTPKTLVQKCSDLSILKPMTNHGILIVPPRALAHTDHSKLWTVEKLVTISMLLVTPVAIAAPNIVFDNIFAIILVAHQHWGLESCIVDYLRPIIVGDFLHRVFIVLLWIVSAVTLGCLLNFNFNDVGFGRAVRQLWAIKAVEK